MYSDDLLPQENFMPEFWSSWEINNRLSYLQIEGKLNTLNRIYVGKFVKHKEEGKFYCIGGFHVHNYEGKAAFAVDIYPVERINGDRRDIMPFGWLNVKFSYLCEEFFDGRFIIKV